MNGTLRAILLVGEARRARREADNAVARLINGDESPEARKAAREAQERADAAEVCADRAAPGLRREAPEPRHRKIEPC